MKIKKITLRLTGAVACVTAFLIGATPMTALHGRGKNLRRQKIMKIASRS